MNDVTDETHETHEGDAQYAFDLVKRICDEVGPGLPGSAQERARALIVKEELAAHLGADNVTMEEFDVAPRAALASLPIAALLTLAAAVLIFVDARWAAFAAFACSLAAVLAQRHRVELERLDARLVNMEMVAHPVITILRSDLNGVVKTSADLVRSLVAAAESAGVPYRVRRAGPGIMTDAVPFRRLGLRAATLFPFRMPQQLVAFYHQREDAPDVVTLPPLANVMKLALAWIAMNDVRSTP